MWAMIVKEFRQLRRDRRTLAMMIVLPVVLLVVFGYAASFDVSAIPAVWPARRPPGSAGARAVPGGAAGAGRGRRLGPGPAPRRSRRRGRGDRREARWS